MFKFSMSRFCRNAYFKPLKFLKANLVLTIFVTLHLATGNFNFFVDKEEFHRITGATRSIIYLVRDGVVNEYALSHVMNIPHHIQYLDFKWQVTGKKPVHYELHIEFSDLFALLQPSVNISKAGRLPNRLKTFRIHLPCSGRLTTEVPVTILFFFNVKHAIYNNPFAHNVTQVKVKRNKICLLASQKVNLNIHAEVHSNATTTTLATPTTSQPPTYLLHAGVFATCAISGSLMPVVLFLIYLKYRLNRLKQESRPKSNTSNGSVFDEEESPACLIRNREQSTPPPIPTQIMLKPCMTSARIRNNAYDKEAKKVSPYAYAQIVQPRQVHFL